MKDIKRHIIWIAPLLAMNIVFWMIFNDWSFQSAFTVGVASLCALWWIFEPIPIPITSLIPLASGIKEVIGIGMGSKIHQSAHKDATPTVKAL